MSKKKETRKEVKYNRPVGIIDGTLYLVNYTFEDTMHDKPFKGVTGSLLEPITKRQIEEYTSPDAVKDYCLEPWKESVRAGATEQSLDGFVEDCDGQWDGDYPGHDFSDVRFVPDEIKEKYFPDAETFNCIGRGRCFSKGMKWDIVIDPFLVSEINRLEESEKK